MPFAVIPIEEGHRNYVIQVNGRSPDDPAAVLVDVAGLNPPCEAVRLMRVSYDVDVGEEVDLFFDGDADPFLTMSEGNGQTICYKKIGGIPNRRVGGGNVTLSSVTGEYTLTLHFVKQNPVIPL